MMIWLFWSKGEKKELKLSDEKYVVCFQISPMNENPTKIVHELNAKAETERFTILLRKKS